MMRNSNILNILIATVFVAIAIGCQANPIDADTLDFRVDPATLDDNMDGYINGDEFQPVGSDGVLFGLVPISNLGGIVSFQLSETEGLKFGGGALSTLSFDFDVSQNIRLESYTTPDSIFIINNPIFDILDDGGNILSQANSADVRDMTYLFNGGPIDLSAGSTYTFQVTNSGAAIQSFMQSWQYTTTSVPEPGSLAVLFSVGAAAMLRRRK